MTKTNIHNSKSEPAQFLVENVAILPKGRVLDLAMGCGRNALYLANLGFEVEGIDISTQAVNTALIIAKAAGVAIRTQVVGLESYTIKNKTYDVIICFSYLQRSHIPQIKEGLKRGGMVVYETFIVDQAKIVKPTNPDYLLEHNELLNMFRDFRCLRYREGIFQGPKAIASIIAEKV